MPSKGAGLHPGVTARGKPSNKPTSQRRLVILVVWIHFVYCLKYRSINVSTVNIAGGLP